MKLSNEEKEAIKYLNKYIKWETYGERSLEKDIKTVLDIIENLQKEIDDWKFTTKYIEDNYVDKSKIRKKIEELKREKKNLLQLPEDCARNICLEDCDEKIAIYEELLEE